MSFPQGAGLYLISDRHQVPDGKLAEFLIAAAQAGVAAIQIREKDLDETSYIALAKQVIAQVPSGVPVILNRRPQLVGALGADGVHLGIESLPEIQQLRRTLPAKSLIGVSCHSFNELRTASQLADFATISPFFPTSSKPLTSQFLALADLPDWQRQLSIPCFPLGGIGLAQARQLAQLGIHRLACIQAVLAGKSSNEVQARVHALRDAILGTTA